MVGGRSNALPAGDAINSGDVAWMLTASALVLLMTPGLSFFYGGMVGFKNVVSTMLQSVVALGVISLVWVAGRLQPGLRRQRRAASIGNPLTFFMFDGVGEATHQGVCADDPADGLRDVPAQVRDHHAGPDHRARSPSGCGSRPTCCSSSCSACSSTARWPTGPGIPTGFLRKWGVLDFAGGTVVHMSAGWAALAGAMILGRRKSHLAKEAARRRRTSRSCSWARGCSGSAGSASTPARPWRPTARRRWRSRPPTRPRPRRCSAGCSSTGCGATSRRRWAPASAPWSAWWRSRPRPASSRSARASSSAWSPASISNLAVHWKTKSTLDDTLDVFPCHGVGGMVGMIVTGHLRQGRRPDLAARPRRSSYHLLALVIVSVFSSSARSSSTRSPT